MPKQVPHTVALLGPYQVTVVGQPYLLVPVLIPLVLDSQHTHILDPLKKRLQSGHCLATVMVALYQVLFTI